MGLNGDTLPPGEVGELWARGPNIVKGYWNKPQATAETFVDGWVKTGDLARLDEEGFCFIIDRAKDMLIRGGENIYCIEVENVLYEHPAVMDAALIAMPHKTLGEEPAAVVHLKPGLHASEDELRAFVAGQARRVQGAGESDLLARNAAPQRQRQDHEERAEEDFQRSEVRRFNAVAAVDTRWTRGNRACLKATRA